MTTSIVTLLKEQGAKNIRFYFAGSGCCGPQVGLSIDEPAENDMVQEINEISVAIDANVKEMTDSLTLDHQEGGFVLVGMPESNCC
ncbi:adhesin [Fictibacillus sp. KU28468]|uniref:adhesin n=1 Tax=Fictibacillus sp. KU28468 TaxID=2991053 RepID=UPI00223D64EA|nr:adhesin [Fictibacillus sp. KU28468]UZJ80560.1 adhesin [Fictibacillus sp. KU28468]